MSVFFFFFSVVCQSFFFLNFMNFLLVIHESDIQCFCTPKNQIKLAFCTPKNEKKRNEESYLYSYKKIVFRNLKVRTAGKFLQNCYKFKSENYWRTQLIWFILCFLFASSVIYEGSGVLRGNVSKAFYSTDLLFTLAVFIQPSNQLISPRLHHVYG